jgi:hypothetical protein
LREIRPGAAYCGPFVSAPAGARPMLKLGSAPVDASPYAGN